MGNRIDEIVNRPGPAPQPSATPPPNGNGARPTPSPSPQPSPTPPSNGGKTSGEVRFSPSEIKQLGMNIERELDAIFKQARYKLNGAPRDVETSAWTTFGFAMSMVHTEVIEYADQDLITKSKHAMDINDRLQKVAANQDEAERKSTVKGI